MKIRSQIYELAPGITQTVFRKDDILFAQRTGGDKILLVSDSTAIFFREGIEGGRLFRRGDREKVDARIDRRNNQDVLWQKVR